MPYKEDDLDLFQDAEDQEDIEDEPVPESDANGYDMEYEEDDNPPSEQPEDGEDVGDQGEELEEEMDSEPKQHSTESIVALGSYKDKFPVKVNPALVDANTYDFTATTAFIQGTQTYSMAFSWGTKFLFTGGADGFIRRYAFVDSVLGTQPLTISQRPTFVDTIVNAGVLKGYWENEQPLDNEKDYKFDSHGTYLPQVSPVYSLVAQSEALWVAAGLESGGISLQSARHSEGTIAAYLNLHTSTVSELSLGSDEQHLLSGSWDKTVAYWDLNTCTPIRHYRALNGQISTIAWQPLGGPLCSSEDNKSIDSLFGEEENEQEAKGSPKAEEEQSDKGEKLNNGQIFMTSTISGAVELWDIRSAERCLQLSGSTAPPWCMSAGWSPDGIHVFAGRRNNSVDEYDIRMSSAPSRTFKFPSSSGSVTSLIAMPNGKSLLCASSDNMRVYDLTAEATKKTPFYIVPGHHGVMLSRLLLDPSGNYLLTSSGGRGWNEGASSDMVLCYEVEPSSE